MRYLAMAAIAVGALGASQLIDAKPAQATVNYPYCMQGALQGYPGDCNYSTFASCRYTANGTGGNCVANPRYSAWDRGYDSYGYAPANDYPVY